MSIATRIENMTNNLENAYNNIEDLGIDLTNTNKNLENLSTVLEEVYENYPKVSGTGTDITLNNTAKGKMEIDLKGNTEQTTYTGKNLLKPDKNLTPSTMEGITFTPVYEDGILKRIDITGTSTGRAYYYLQSTNQPFGDVSGNITISITGTASGINLNQDNYIDNIYKASQIASGTVKATYNPSNLGYTQYRNYINIPFTTATTYNTSVYPMFEPGDTATPYEPYAGGTTSPNPDYSQDVRVVTGENTVKVVNKNLFNKNNIMNSIRLGSDGLPYNDINYCTSDYFEIKSNTVYSFNPLTESCALCVYDKNKNFVYRWLGGNITTATTPNGVYYARLAVQKTRADEFQIEENSTATTYEEHKEQDFPISLSSKNKADLSTFEIGYIGSSGQIWKQGINNGEKSSQYIKVKPNTTYTFTIVETQSQYDNWFGVGEYSNNDVNNFIQRITMTIATQNYFTFTTSNTTKYVRLSARNLEGATKIQFNESLTPTILETYQPYYNYELCKIGDYKDYIYKNNGSWYIKKMINKVDLSTLTWILNSGRFIADNIPNGITAPINTRLQVYSDYYKYANSGTPNNGIFYYINGNVTQLYVYNSKFTTLNDYNNWTNQIKPAAYYLEIPIDIEITDTTLISQLEAIYNTVKSYKGQTHIYTITEDGNVASVLDAIALLDSNP